MAKIIAIAVREFVVTVRTKAFLLTVVLMPGLMTMAIFGTKYVQALNAREKIPTRRLAVVDHTGAVFTDLQAQFDRYNAEHVNKQFSLEQIPAAEVKLETLTGRVQNGDLYGYAILPPDALNLNGTGTCELARADDQLQIGEEIESRINGAIFTARCRLAGIDVDRVSALRKPIHFNLVDARTGAARGGNKFARLLTPFAFMFLLFMGIFGISQGLLTTVIEEKSSRVAEVLLSAVSSTQLMAGKILGTVMVGFVLLGVWGAIGYCGARTYDVADLVTPFRLTLAVLYFVPGFLLMASLLAAIGSACNELKEAQSMVFPLSILTIVPMIFWFFIAEHPASVFSVALSYVPPITPFVMILRICSDPQTPWWQIATTLALLWVAVVLAIWAAGKVFRVGVLMYGKPPSLVELLRWVRYS